MIAKVCIVTASRSEYGLLRWLIDEVKDDSSLQLQLIVTGGHLSAEQGYTYKDIENDGYIIDCKIEMLLSADSQTSIVKSMGLCSISIAEALTNLQPDIIVVLGDRYELLPICNAALVMNIPIAHISGGDVTSGAIDDQIRNAITMMSSIHFPGVEESSKRIMRMVDSPTNVYTVGEPGLDNFNRLKFIDREKLSIDLGIDINKKWILFTYHPETKITVEKNLLCLKNALEDILSLDDIELIATKANADFGGVKVNKLLENYSKKHLLHLYDSLGQLRYLSIMKESFCIIGNSSSGICEAPFLGKPVINIGNRQNGRYLCENIINVNGEKKSVFNALKMINSKGGTYKSDTYFGDGNASYMIKEYLKKYLLNR